MIKFLAFIIISTLFSSCNRKSKGTFKWTDVICNQLYVETYIQHSAGTEGAERLSQYLTDSANFRIHIGNIVQGRDYNSYECYGDTITIKKKLYGKTEQTKTFSITTLKTAGIYE